MRRPRLDALLDEAVERERVTIVTAASGYGKTSAVSDWAVNQDLPVAWLSLGSFDSSPSLLAGGVLRALRSVMRDDIPLPDLGALSLDTIQFNPGAIFRRLMELIDRLDRPIVLVIDDAQRARAALRADLLGALIESGSEQLRLVLIGTSALEVELSRYVLMHPDAVIRAPQLTFTVSEVAALAGPGRPKTPEDVFGATQGWPIAVRLLYLDEVRATIPAGQTHTTVFADYLRDHVLNDLEPALRDFVLDTTIGVGLTSELAAAIAGPGAQRHLEECVRRGLFIDRISTSKGTVYRWHDVFAKQCQILRGMSDRDRQLRSHRRAAAYLEGDDPLGSITQWLLAEDADEAMRVLLDHWMWLIVGADPRALDQACLGFPQAQCDDPRMLLIRACAHEVLGMGGSARKLTERATASRGSVDAGELEWIRQISQLLIEDDRDVLTRLCTSVYDQLERTVRIAPRQRLAILYTIGWAGLRLRSNPSECLQALEATAHDAEALGEVTLASRAIGHLATLHAWAGYFNHVRDALTRLDALADGADGERHWEFYAGGSASTAQGVACFWAGDVMAAQTAFTRVIQAGGSDHTFAGIARTILVFATAATGDAEALGRAARQARAIPREDLRGLPWSVYRNAALAALCDAHGQRSRALRIAERVVTRPGTPMMTVLLSDIIRRNGYPQQALAYLHALKPVDYISYVRVATLATRAIVKLREGDAEEAHRLCERSLEVAADQRIRYFYSHADAELRQFLTAHLAWGTKQERFLVDCLSSQLPEGPLQQLSERELAVFAQLRTTRTLQEIADELEVSINTVKTHQRAIHRKLGVSSRREAIRRFG
jgi:LuxR family maltose regulon positive regulatory protein